MSMALMMVCDLCGAMQADPPPTSPAQSPPEKLPRSARERATAHGWLCRETLMQPDLCPVCVAEAVRAATAMSVGVA